MSRENDRESEHELYAVFRNGRRVSDSTYPSEFFANGEYEYWRGIIAKWPDGSRIDVRRLWPRNRREDEVE